MLDWAAIETEYITTNVSLRALAEKYGAAFMTMGRHSKKGGWTQKRAAYEDRVKIECIQKAVDDTTTTMLDWRESGKQVCEYVYQALVKAAANLATIDAPAPRDVTEIAKALAAHMDNAERVLGAGEDSHITLELGERLKEYAE